MLFAAFHPNVTLQILFRPLSPSFKTHFGLRIIKVTLVAIAAFSMNEVRKRRCFCDLAVWAAVTMIDALS